ncbi:MAG: hypothetical protein ACAH95_01430 [Fimbriimonas sp.]
MNLRWRALPVALALFCAVMAFGQDKLWHNRLSSTDNLRESRAMPASSPMDRRFSLAPAPEGFVLKTGGNGQLLWRHTKPWIPGTYTNYRSYVVAIESIYNEGRKAD